MATLRGLHRWAASCRSPAPQLLSLRTFLAAGWPCAAPSVPLHHALAPHLQHQGGHPQRRHYAAAAASAAAAPFKLVLYSKPDCPLCDKLKEKLGALMDRAAFVPSVLSGVELEVRDIGANQAWTAAYSTSVPVLAAAQADGSAERELPRPSPRLTADALEKHLAKALHQAGLVG